MASTNGNEEAREIRKKICLLGEAAVGKTSLINRFVFNQFDDKYISTMGTKVSKKVISLDQFPDVAFILPFVEPPSMKGGVQHPDIGKGKNSK